MNALGINPGTTSFDFSCLNDRTTSAVYETSGPTSVVAKSPESLLGVVKEAEADVIVGPLAMGLPVTRLSEMTDLKLAQATLGKNTEVDIAIRRFIKMLQGLNLNVFNMAQDAALIASGLAGRTYAELVDVLELRAASGTVLDYIRWLGFDVEERINKKLREMKMVH